MSELFIGLMSGTSLDGVDGVLANFEPARPEVLAHASAPLTAALHSELLALNQAGDNELHRAALAANALMEVYADVVMKLLSATGTAASAVRAVGAHGQTVRHQPLAHAGLSGRGYSLQLANPALLAELTGIDVVADFRSRDVAAGGQGAPLVPVFHQTVFGRPDHETAVLNIGGMANLTVIGATSTKDLLGFDCGPGNVLLDAWCQQHLGQSFDANGSWAASGTVHPPLLTELRSDPYFSLPAPKSTGRDLFHLVWLRQHLASWPSIKPEDVQATLTELTTSTCADSFKRYAQTARELFVCGGGALNSHLMHRLQLSLPHCQVQRTDQAGLPAQQVEATAFAWLARKAIQREPLSLEKITGAKGARIAGAIYPA